MNQIASATCRTTSAVAEYISGCLARPLPAEVIQKSKCHLIDTVAAIVSGSQLKAGKVAARFIATLGGHNEATVMGTEFVSSVVHAAFCNAMAAHADETDDSHLEGLFHPGCAIVPAAYAAAELEGKSGADLLKAIALGYDIGARFNMSLGFSAPRSGTHSTHSIGTLFGAAAASGALLNVTPEQAAFLLSYATQQASGVPYWNRDTDHIEKSFDFAGKGAKDGVFIALMIKSGFTGVVDSLVNKPSFLSAFAEHAKPEELTRELGQRYEIMQASIKKWCVGSPIQAALDALMALIETHDLKADQVEKIVARMPDDRLHIVDNRDMPDICLQHLIAIGLLDHGLTFKSCHDKERMTDPAVLKLREKIEAVPDRMLTEAKPSRQAILEVTTTRREVLSHRTRAVLGTPDNPMSEDEISSKSFDLLAPVLGDKKAEVLLEALWSVESIEDVGALRPLLLLN